MCLCGNLQDTCICITCLYNLHSSSSLNTQCILYILSLPPFPSSFLLPSLLPSFLPPPPFPPIQHTRLLSVVESLDNGMPIRESRDCDISLVARHFYHHSGTSPSRTSNTHRVLFLSTFRSLAFVVAYDTCGEVSPFRQLMNMTKSKKCSPKS